MTESDPSQQARSVGVVAIGVLGLDGRWVRVDEEFGDVLGRPREWLLAWPATAVVHPEDRAVVQAMLGRVLRGEIADRRWQIRWVTARGVVRSGPVTVVLLRSAHGAPQQAVVVVENLERRRIVLADLHDAASRDDLTGLQSRAGAYSRLRSWLEAGRGAGLVFCDVDRFKIVNDALGHRVGDLLLIAVGERLVGAAPPEAVVARMGGDEFLIAVPGCTTDAAVVAVATRIQEAFAEPVSVERHVLAVSVALGAVLAAPDTVDGGRGGVDVAVCHADIAMYEAKRASSTVPLLYTETMGARIQRRQQVETALRAALATRQLTIVYQPVIYLGTGRWGGAEVLARWDDEVLGVVDPEEFIAVAEDAGLICELTQQVAKQACADLEAWHTEGLATELRLGFNISAGDLTDASLVSWFGALLDQHTIAPRMLVLEVTETTLLHAGQDTVQVLQELDALGAEVALDDFGTGYSSLGDLRTLPVRQIKIDRSFISGLTPDPAAGDGVTDLQFVAGIVALADHLGMQVLAEGVETEQQHRDVLAAGCFSAQGYLYEKPLTAADMVNKLRNYAPQLPTATLITHPTTRRPEAAE